ncbi:MAG: 50S ribosomal protein L15 [Alphaproteobacteria bacterium]|nr:50S ribosomal protein L15 [Alphaproteobacteria bacterium]
MRLNEINERSGARKSRKRVGRGMASGTGKTSGKGHKGQKSRSGVSLLGFEGGQMPLYRRLPKRGFNNPFTKDYAELTLASLERAVANGKIDAKKPVTESMLREAGVVRKSRNGVRLLATGEIKSKVTLEVTGATKGAIAAMEKAGGKVTVATPKPKPEGKGKARHRKFKEGAEQTKPKIAEAEAPAEDVKDEPAADTDAEEKAGAADKGED